MTGYPRRKKGETEGLAGFIAGWSHRLVDYFVCAYIVLTAAVLPLYSEHGYSYIATEKSLFFRRMSLNMGRAVILLLLVHMLFSLVLHVRKSRKVSLAMSLGRLRAAVRRFAPTDFFAVLYGVSLSLSYLFSDYRQKALWGADGWYMGLYTQMVLLASYFLISRLWKPRKGYFYLMLGISVPVFLLGYLNRFGVYPIEMEMSNPGFISTIGNINWYCGYAVTVFFSGVALLWQGNGLRPWEKVFLSCYGGLGFGTLVTQGSLSGIVALGAVLLALLVLSAEEGVRMERFWLVALLLGGACLVTDILRAVFPERINYPDSIMNLLTTGVLPWILAAVSLMFLLWTHSMVKKGKYLKKAMRIGARTIMTAVSLALFGFLLLIVINTLHPGSFGSLSQYSVFTFSGTWGSSRGETWMAGIRCFWEQDFLHKLFGVGPDAMAAYIYSDGSPELTEPLKEAFGTLVLTNVHNEWLTILVDTGIFGLISFVGMVVSAMVRFLKKTGRQPLAAACGISLLAYTVNNFFSFQQVMNTTLMYMIMGMGAAFLSENFSEEVSVKSPESPLPIHGAGRTSGS